MVQSDSAHLVPPPTKKQIPAQVDGLEPDYYYYYYC